MLGKRVTPEATLSYIVAGDETEYDTIADAEQAGRVEGVKLTYCCPYCDAPNVEVYTTPIPDGVVARCQRCEYDTNMTPSVPNTGTQFSADDLANVPRQIEALREQRLNGERESGLTTEGFRRQRLLAFALATVSFAITTFSGTALAVWGLTASLLAVSALGVGIMLAGIFVTFFILDNTLNRGIESDIGSTDPRVNRRAARELFKRGLKRRNQRTVDPPMYRPNTEPSAEATSDKATVEEEMN